MFQKLNRDRSTRNQTRASTGSNGSQNTPRRQYSSSGEENGGRRENSEERSTRNYKKIHTGYPPLEDYAE